MTISTRVKNELYDGDNVISIPPSRLPSHDGSTFASYWTPEEHAKFLEALRLYPSGTWKDIARHIGTKSSRQASSHAQKYRQKIARRQKYDQQRAQTIAQFGSASATSLDCQEPECEPNENDPALESLLQNTDEDFRKGFMAAISLLDLIDISELEDVINS